MTTTVSQEAREAAASILPSIYGALYSPAMGERCVRGIMDEGFLVQAFHEFEQSIRQQAERGEAWRPIETAPLDEPILAAIKVHHRNGDTWWERHVIVIDSETGTISDMDYHHGWEADDYEAWQPLPTPPEAV